MINQLIDLLEQFIYTNSSADDSIDLHIRKIKEHLAQSYSESL